LKSQSAAISPAGLQALVFGLVSASFTTIYLPQPVLPVLQQEFGVDEKQASYAISSVILGIALSNLPFGRAADRFPVKPIILSTCSFITWAAPPASQSADTAISASARPG
jgi:MFS transporter, YNFM family, putative membrane transport protein